MFRDIFPNKLNRLVYEGPRRTPEAARVSAGSAKETDAAASGASALDKALSRAPITKEQKQAQQWMEKIFQASGSRTRHEKMRPAEAARLVSGVGAEIQTYMSGKKEALIPAANGNTLLLKKMPNGGIVAVAYEAQGNEKAPRPAEHIVIGAVSKPIQVAASMVSEFFGSPLHAGQEKIAKLEQPRIGQHSTRQLRGSDLGRLTRPEA